MGLDIYVGSFTRYYAGDWELIAARAARELGAEFNVIRHYDPPEALRDPEEIRPLVLEWRNGLSESLASSLAEPLDWREDADARYFTDKPAWDGYQGLLLWTAYEEHPEFERPSSIPEHIDRDPAIKLSMNERKTRYPALLFSTNFWLPVRLPFVFETVDVGGKKAVIGSSYSLEQELSELNQRTWKMSDDELDYFAREGCEKDSPLEVAARFAYTLFQRHARLSVTHRLPMLLDW
jgi:hypothetical protein